MSNEFWNVVDPLLIKVLDILQDIQTLTAPSLTGKLSRVIDDADASLRKNEDWSYAKYAIVAWIDDEVINVHNEWRNKPLEARYFESGDAHTLFFEKAREAVADQCADAVEVFYICFMFGFRGVYDERDGSRSSEFDLPAREFEWQAQMSKEIRSLKHVLPEWEETFVTRASTNRLDGRNLFTNSLVFLFFSVLAFAACLVFRLFPQIISS